MKRMIKKIALHILGNMPFLKDLLYGRRVYKKYCREHHDMDAKHYMMKYHASFLEVLPRHKKAKQVAILLKKVSILPIEGKSFFYSLDCNKGLRNCKTVFSNYMIDNNVLVKHSLADVRKQLLECDDKFGKEEMIVLNSLEAYLKRCRHTPEISDRFGKQLDAIESLFSRPADSLFEGLQRILFFNQFLWQTGHKLNGLGHLDWILGDLYEKDIRQGVLTRDEVRLMLKDFMTVLHEYYWFKSSVLMGDTGQIIILGGMGENRKYIYNDLTKMFIEVSEELRLPDPKVLLRCSLDMPEDILNIAVKCISTGIGAPLLSNDDVVIPAMCSFGYDEIDAVNYGTAACWEPLAPGISCDQNNIAPFNFALPLVKLLDSQDFENVSSIQGLLELYKLELVSYVHEVLEPLSLLQFECDPLMSLVSLSALEKRRDFTEGGAKYNHLGLTSVGMGTVVNSLLNLQRLVFDEKRYTFHDLNEIRKQNFAGQDQLVQELKGALPCYGCDDQRVLLLTHEIMQTVSIEFEKYHTLFGGRFKIGLSSPSYIGEAEKIGATFDGRRSGEPFSVHISSNTALPTTELLSFASQLDYNGNRLNGNVIDFFATPNTMKQNMKKYVALLRAGVKQGIFQLQMNVVESKTLIAAKEHPEKFPQLVVRVWGFSAYFNDLPDEYKDVLIARAIENEKAA